MDAVVDDENDVFKIVAGARVGAASVESGEFGGEHIFNGEKADWQIGGDQLVEGVRKSRPVSGIGTTKRAVVGRHDVHGNLFKKIAADHLF